MKQLDKLAEIVKAHALEHYEDGGWDVIMECWTNKEIQEHLEEAKATTPEEAIKAFQWLVNVYAERQADAVNSAF